MPKEISRKQLDKLIRESIRLNTLFGEHVKECEQCRKAHQDVLCESGYKLWYEWVIFPTED